MFFPKKKKKKKKSTRPLPPLDVSSPNGQNRFILFSIFVFFHEELNK